MEETCGDADHLGSAMKSMGFVLLSFLLAGMVLGQSMKDEEFTDEDFAQFFGLIEEGKISQEKMNARCAKEIVGFTFAGKDIVHERALERVNYNETGMNGSVDGRALRSRHFNATFGEWTGAVFKPLCPGMWVISMDFAALDSGPAAVDSAQSDGWAEAVRVLLYIRRAGEQRPGTSVVHSAGIKGGGSGHLTIALPLHTGDEVSTYSEAVGEGSKRGLEQITFTAYKIGHLQKYVKEFDVDAWNAELEALKQDGGTMMP